MKKEIQLSDLQMAIMRVLWQDEEATAAQVHQTLLPERALAFTTITTTITRLEKKKLIDHRKQGRQFVYRALVEEKDVRLSMVADLVDKVFQGDSSALFNHLLNDSEISEKELDRIKQMIEAAETEQKEKNDD